MRPTVRALLTQAVAVVRMFAIAFIPALLTMFVPGSAFAQTYSVTSVSSLGSLGGTGTSYAGGLSDTSYATGYAYTTNNTAYHAFTTLGLFRDLGTLGGSFSIGEAIGDYGIAGRSSLSGDSTYQAFIWGFTGYPFIESLGTLGGSYSSAQGISDSGLTTGYSTLAGDIVYHAFANQGQTDLGTLGGTYSAGLGINSSGVVVGYSTTANNAATHGFVWNSGTMTDLGTLGGTFSSATAINEVGSVTGRAAMANNSTYHAFVATSGGALQDLGTLPGGSYSSGQGISLQGVVVGFADTGTATHAFVAFGGKMYDLNTLINPGDPNYGFVTLTYAKSITDSVFEDPNVAVGAILALGNDTRTNAGGWYILSLVSPPAAVSASTVTAGQSSTLTVTPAGAGPFSYQWFQGGSGDNSNPIAGATGASFTTPPLSASTNYWVLITTPLGTEGSATITITVSGGSGDSTDGPIPLWALGALGAGLLGIAARRLKKAD